MHAIFLHDQLMSEYEIRYSIFYFFFFQAEDGIRDYKVTGVQTCALPIGWPWRCLRGFGLGEVGGERVELRLPVAAVPLDPAGRLSHGAGDQPAAAHPAMLGVSHEPPALEHAQVLVNAGERDGEGARQLGDRRLAPREAGERSEERRVGKECRSRWSP